jgi:hypothetical protein
MPTIKITVTQYLRQVATTDYDIDIEEADAKADELYLLPWARLGEGERQDVIAELFMDGWPEPEHGWRYGSADIAEEVVEIHADNIEHEVYAKCKHCHLFVDENDGHGEGVAKYIHLHRGDDADEAIDASHEPEPGETATLAWWRINGPAEMRARFTNTDKEN